MIKKYWEKFTDLFGETIIHPQFIILSTRRVAIEKIKKISENKELIDLGCGRMPYRKELEPRLKKYLGVDHPQISHLYDSDQKPDILADITKKIPVKDKSFDTAIMLEVLEYLEKPLNTFKEANRILRRNGFLILTTPFLYPLHDIPYDRNRFSSTQIKYFLTTSGFRLKSIEENGNFLAFWILNLNVYLTKTIMDILNTSKRNKYRVIYLFPIALITPIIVITGNIIFILTKNIKIASKNYFPIDYLITAIKQ